ncbi:IS1182 family transposase [Streptomyces cocklensis]|nr:IS1182 family transposase [Actinacidiphila cocklensis]MDD1064067.1 IS1182 family transposase [Actinacidiphila cocklensis]
MESQPWPEPAPGVVRAVRAKYRGRPVPLPVAVRDGLGEVFADAEFASAFAATGPRGWSPGRLALVTVLQMAENLTDRQAAEAVRDKLSWAYALGLGLEDPGFDFSVLSQFRTRVAAHHLEEKVLDLLLAALLERGLLAAGGKQRTDSTHVVAAVRDLNRLELAGEAVRAAVEALTCAAPDWVAQVVDVASWSKRYGARVDGWRLPTSQVKQEQLAVDFARDGFALLGAVYHPNSPVWLRELPAVQVLRIVLLQNYTRTIKGGREVVKRRQKAEDGGDGRPPGHLRLSSPYDTDSRWSVKRDTLWNGYKLHISETCTSAPESGRKHPNLITNVATTSSTLPDSKALDAVHHTLQQRRLLPEEHYLDSGYATAELIQGSLKTYGVALVTPVLLDTSRQAKDRNGFAAHDFTIDWHAEQATCPAGKTSVTWNPVVQAGLPKTVATFAALDCIPCPHRSQCTSAKSNRRQITLHPREMTEALRNARAQQQTKDWNKNYALRAGIEGTIRQATAVTGVRRARYRGLEKTHLEHVYSAVALNLIRLHAWWHNQPLDRTRTSHLTRLELTLTA